MVKLSDTQREKIEKEVLENNFDIEAANKGSYDHFMLKEIMEEPIVLQRTLNKYLNNPDEIFVFSKLESLEMAVEFVNSSISIGYVPLTFGRPKQFV